jgi:hypothetical protein
MMAHELAPVDLANGTIVTHAPVVLTICCLAVDLQWQVTLLVMPRPQRGPAAGQL